MKKIIEYKIVWDRDDDRLIKKVNKEIKEGWQPQGGITYDTQYGIYLQVMVKYEE